MSKSLDEIDLKILNEIQADGRITNVELAELVNLSPSPCLMRVKKLQSEGFITGYSAQEACGRNARFLMGTDNPAVGYVSLLFVPVGVGVVTQLGLVAEHGLRLLVVVEHAHDSLQMALRLHVAA